MQQQEIAFIVMLAVIGASLVFVGLVGMLVVNHFKEKRLAPFLTGKELSEEWLETASLFHSLREVGLGLLITLVVPIFTHYCLVGTASDLVARVAGFGAGVLCALGSFFRQSRNLDCLGLGTEAKTILWTLGFFAFSLMTFLWGALTLSIALYFLAQQL